MGRSHVNLAGGCSAPRLKAAISKTSSWKLSRVLLWLTLTTVGRHGAARSTQ